MAQSKALGNVVKLRDIVNIKEPGFGAKCDDATDDTAAWTAALAAAFAAGVALFHPGGMSKVTAAVDATPYYGISIYGVGHHANTLAAFDNVVSGIKQYGNDVQVLRLQGGSCRIQDLWLGYNEQQTRAQTNSITLELNNVGHGSSFRNLKLQRGNTNIGIPQSAFDVTTYNVVWDSVFENIDSWEASECHYDFRNFNGGGTNCSLDKLYVNGGGSLTFAVVGQDCNYAFRFTGTSGYEIGAVSVDGIRLLVSAFEMVNPKLSMRFMRMEGVEFTFNSGSFFRFGGGEAYVDIGQVHIDTCRWTPAAGTEMYIYKFDSTSCRVRVGFTRIKSDCVFTVIGTRRIATDASTPANSHIEIGPVYDEGAQLSDTAAWSGVTQDLNSIKVFNGAVVHLKAKGGRVGTYVDQIWGTAPPAAGTWKVGDICWNTRPDNNGISYWECTTAGTPGVWEIGAIIRSKRVSWFEDFLGDVLADQWNGRVGSDPQCVTPTILADTESGVVRLVTGDDGGATMALNGSQLESSLNWRASADGLVFEARVRVSTTTFVALFVGLTDQNAALELPFELGGGDALTSNATDAVGVLYDVNADTDQWCLVGVANNVDAAKEFAGVAPGAGVFETWRIEITTAGVATFYRNGVKVGSAMVAAVTASVKLTPVIAACSRGAVVRNIDADYVTVGMKRF